MVFFSNAEGNAPPLLQIPILNTSRISHTPIYTTLLPDEAPQLVELELIASDVPDLLAHEAFAGVADPGHHGVLL